MEDLRVSCLMVTQPGREALASQAVDCFRAQTYRNKELLVLTTGGGEHYRRWVDVLRALRAEGHRATLVARADGRLAGTLGALRNMANRCASGHVFIQWDDDDLYHPGRIAAQVEPIAAGAIGSCLVDQIYYVAATNRFAWVDWSLWGAVRPLIPGTIAVRREAAIRAQYPSAGPRSARGEDDPFLSAVLEQGAVAPIAGRGTLYVRRHHGNNTWNEGHFVRNIRQMGRTLSSADLDAIAGPDGLSAYPALQPPWDFANPDGAVVHTVHPSTGPKTCQSRSSLEPATSS